MNAVSCPDPLATRYWLYEQVVSVVPGRVPEQVAGPWTRVAGEVCQTQAVAGVPGIAQVLAAVQAEWVTKRPAVPVVRVQPAPQVLVSVANGFSAGSAAPVRLADTVLGLPVEITATPVRWVWDFGDGSALTTVVPGRPGSLEVAHAYGRVADPRVGVVVEWSGSFTVGGLAGSFPIEGVARVAAAPVLVQVRQARAELVAQ